MQKALDFVTIIFKGLKLLAIARKMRQFRAAVNNLGVESQNAYEMAAAGEYDAEVLTRFIAASQSFVKEYGELYTSITDVIGPPDS